MSPLLWPVLWALRLLLFAAVVLVVAVVMFGIVPLALAIVLLFMAQDKLDG